MLDEHAPLEKLNKELELKNKPWITKEILFLMWKRDKLLSKYHRIKDRNIKIAHNHIKHKELNERQQVGVP